MNEDAELLMTLYDGRDFKPITENYVIKWSKEGLASNIDQLNNFKVLFTVSDVYFYRIQEKFFKFFIDKFLNTKFKK